MLAPPPIISISNVMTVKFTVDVSYIGCTSTSLGLHGRWAASFEVTTKVQTTTPPEVTTISSDVTTETMSTTTPTAPLADFYCRTSRKWTGYLKSETVSFQSDNDTCFTIACGICQTVSPSEGTIQSPYYPNYFGSDPICSYTIVAPVGKQVQLTFTDFLVNPLWPICNFISVSQCY